jgi:mannose-6-phosphate isomerase-like protein (cupin superfamily)
LSVEPKIIHSAEVPEYTPPGGARLRRLIHPNTGCSKVFQMAILVVDPGKSPHRWHRHMGSDSGPGGFSVEYAPGLEEAYIIIHGNGVLQWKVGGKVIEKNVNEGDAIFFPSECVEHQLLNTGSKPMLIALGASPPVTVK